MEELHKPCITSAVPNSISKHIQSNMISRKTNICYSTSNNISEYLIHVLKATAIRSARYRNLWYDVNSTNDWLYLYAEITTKLRWKNNYKTHQARFATTVTQLT